MQLVPLDGEPDAFRLAAMPEVEFRFHRDGTEKVVRVVITGGSSGEAENLARQAD